MMAGNTLLSMTRKDAAVRLTLKAVLICRSTPTLSLRNDLRLIFLPPYCKRPVMTTADLTFRAQETDRL